MLSFYHLAFQLSHICCETDDCVFFLQGLKSIWVTLRKWGTSLRCSSSNSYFNNCIATVEEKNFYSLAQFMSKWKTWRIGSFSFSSKCPLCTVPLQRNSTENWFCHGSASLRALARWWSYSQVGDSLSDGELHWWNGSMICNKTWIAGNFCLTSLGTITIIFLI